MSIVSMTELGQMRGVTAMAVGRAIKSGRLVESVVRDEEGKVLGLDPVIAMREWEANTIHYRASPMKRGGRPRKDGTPARQNPAAEPSGEVAEGGSVSERFSASRAEREKYQAALARLEYEEKSGTLVNADKVRSEAFKIARRVRDGLLNIPDRVSAEVAGITDPFLIHQRLTKEIRQVLVELAQIEAPEDGDE